MALNRLYAASVPLDDSYVSPLFGDFAQGFPRSFIQSGTRDLFLSNAVNMHRALRRAGVEAHLHVFEAMPHGGFFGAPEDEEVGVEIRRFLEECWRSEEHTSELQSLMRISYAVFCLKKKKHKQIQTVPERTTQQ